MCRVKHRAPWRDAARHHVMAARNNFWLLLAVGRAVEILHAMETAFAPNNILIVESGRPHHPASETKA